MLKLQNVDIDGIFYHLCNLHFKGCYFELCFDGKNRAPKCNFR